MDAGRVQGGDERRVQCCSHKFLREFRNSLNQVVPASPNVVAAYVYDEIVSLRHVSFKTSLPATGVPFHTQVVKQGDDGDELFIIRSGEVYRASQQGLRQ